MRPFPLIIIFVALMIIGLALVPGLGIQLHTSAYLPSMRVSWSWFETPAINLEREVTSKIEASLATLRDVEEISSVSARGRGYIDIKFKKGVDIEMTRFEIASRIRRLYPGFPQGVSYPQVSVTRAVGRNSPLLTYTLIAPEATQVIEDYAGKSILPALTRVEGVDQVSFYGTNAYEFQLVYNHRNLEQMGVTTSQISEALQNHFGEYFQGMTDIVQGSDSLMARIPLLLRAGTSTTEDWESIPLGLRNGQLLYMRDVARLRLVEQLPQNYYRINGKSTMMMTIEARQGVNQIRLANRLYDVIEQAQHKMPHQWQIILTYDDTSFIRKDLRRVGFRMGFSFLILMAFVFLVSRRLKYLLLIFITVIANLLLAVAWYHIFDISIHLYSLAGITVSFGILIDNSIVMIEHIRQHGNKRVFLAILAATFTTLGSLSVIFLLGEQQQAQLSDFAGVVLVNLSLSLLIAWFLIPALMQKLNMGHSEKAPRIVRLRRQVKVGWVYLKVLFFVRRFRWAMIVVLILGFGLPVHLLPAKLEGHTKGSTVYNATIGSSFYQRKMKGITEKIMGGSLRLFSRFVFERSYFSDPERTTLYIRGQMPDGATLQQLNDAVLQMEHFLLGYPQIDQFQSRVWSAQNSLTTILFKPEFDRGAFPHLLQSLIVRKAISIGGAEWSVSGVGQGFSNVLRSGSGSSHIVLEGYNYDQLYRYAELLQQKAMENPRVASPAITGGDPWRSANRWEFFLDTDQRKLALHRLTLGDIFAALNEKVMYRHGPVLFHENKPIPLRIVSDQHLTWSVWDMANNPFTVAGADIKTPGMLSLEKRRMGNDIYKFNQEYRLTFNYNFLGPYALEERVRNRLVDEINELLPLGYRARVQQWGWQQEKKQQYILILLVIVIIYFICAILLESLLQPLAVIGIIPVSFAGLFLTFYLFKLNFDQGGWAAFILLSGLAVNAGLYILNDFNNFCNTHAGRNPLRLYLKAFQYKITPVMLTVSSTVIGLIPFVAGHREPFWFAFAAGTMGGLVFSFIGILVFFPVFLRLGAIRGKPNVTRQTTSSRQTSKQRTVAYSSDDSSSSDE